MTKRSLSKKFNCNNNRNHNNITQEKKAMPKIKSINNTDTVDPYTFAFVVTDSDLENARRICHMMMVFYSQGALGYIEHPEYKAEILRNIGNASNGTLNILAYYREISFEGNYSIYEVLGVDSLQLSYLVKYARVELANRRDNAKNSIQVEDIEDAKRIANMEKAIYEECMRNCQFGMSPDQRQSLIDELRKASDGTLIAFRNYEKGMFNGKSIRELVGKKDLSFLFYLSGQELHDRYPDTYDLDGCPINRRYA